ncbi:MAG: tyrosine--tRNA ligase [Candidatus Micrarchaeota archaeon]
MDVQAKIDLVHKGAVLEVLTADELKNLFETEAHPSHYIGFEISGKVHLGTGLCTALKVKDFLQAGIKPTIFLADYHAWINGKLGGDLEKIQTVAKGYFKSAMYASLLCAGLDEEQAGKVRFVLGSELYEKLGNEYWKDVMAISKDTTLRRMLRCTTIMGRTDSENLPSSATLYPAMQAADIWALEVDIAHAGMDQRKVHVLAREWAEKVKRNKPVAVHGALLSGLLGPGRMNDVAAILRGEQRPSGSSLYAAEGILRDIGAVSETEMQKMDAHMIANKMSKSNPDSCIFVHDSEADIARKVKNAYCPPKVIEDNPIVQMAETFVLRQGPGAKDEAERTLKIERPAKFGGDIEIVSSSDLRALYSEAKLHPMDLKNAVARELAAMLEPAREHFQKHPELLEQAL